MVATNVRRASHSQRRAHVQARHESAFCRRENARESRAIIAGLHRSNAFWRRFWSPKQVAKRRRLARIAARRAAARRRREQAALGGKFVHFAKCPTRLSAAAKRAIRKEQAHKAKVAACRRALAAKSASRSLKGAAAAPSSKSAKSRKAKSGRTKC